jgi:site-specific DNA-cytosine methylase
MWESARYAARHAPQVYVFESVTGAYRRGHDVMLGLRSEIERITGRHYTLTHWLHDCAVLGSPTSRQRYMFVAVQGDTPFCVTPVEEYAVKELTTTRDAIGDLSSMDTGVGLRPIPYPTLAGVFGRRLHRKDKMVDGHYNNTDLRRDRGLAPPKWHHQVDQIAKTLQAHGSNWRQGQSEPDALRCLYQAAGLDPLVAIEGEKRAGKFVQNDFNLGAYFACRLIWDAPCGVISGSGGDSFVHPEHDRLLTHRECARIQGWPDELVIEFDSKKFGKEHLGAVWGKAVTPVVARHAAQEIAAWLEQPAMIGKNAGTLIGDREYLIDDLEPSRFLRRMSSDLRRRTLAA